MTVRSVGIAAFALCCISATSYARQRPLVELTEGDKSYQGAAVAYDDSICWLVERDGQLQSVQLGRVTGYRTVAKRFRSYSTAELRDKLRHEFGRDFDVAGKGHYLVCAPRGKADLYADLFDDIYRTFYNYFSRRGFRMSEPDFPLVAVVFPDHKQFGDYSRKQGISAVPGLMGYYLHSTNRVALFDPGSTYFSSTPHRRPNRADEPLAAIIAPRANSLAFDGFVAGRRGVSALPTAGPFGSIQGELKDTIIHEATHQVAFNTGLHSRIGESPKWVVEGLATVFESPGIRNPVGRAAAKSRINHDRFVWFGSYATKRRKPKTLGHFISNDGAFSSATLDAYAQAWALTFYLLETRSSDYAGYLKTIANRDLLKSYSAADRLVDFRQAFGDDLDLLEADMLRFFEKLN